MIRGKSGSLKPLKDTKMEYRAVCEKTQDECSNIFHLRNNSPLLSRGRIALQKLHDTLENDEGFHNPIYDIA